MATILPPTTKWVDAEEPEAKEDNLQLFVIGQRSPHPYYVDMTVNEKKLCMEIVQMLRGRICF